MIELPYTTIGQITVATVLALLVEIIAVGVFILCYTVWYRGLTWVSNRMWDGYTPGEQYPPTYKRKIAVLAIVVRDRDYEKWKLAKKEIFTGDEK